MKPMLKIQVLVAVLFVVATSALAQRTNDHPLAGNPEDLRQISDLLASAGTPRGDLVADQSGTSREIARETGGDAAESTTRTPQLQRRYPRYLVEYGDSLSIQFAFVPDFNQSVTVQPDGYISLREAGDIHVEGLTAPEIAERVRRQYSNILQDPVVTVNLTDFDKPYYVVGGKVGHPGKYDLRGDTTVTQAIAIAGGFNDTSKHSQVLLFRKVSNDWVESTTLNVKKMLRAGNLGEDLHLQPGDMLYVPQNRISKIERFLPVPHPGVMINPSNL